MDKLLSESGCPWDREQTHQSLRENMLEEAYEAVDAINNNDMESLVEELGDVLLQVVFHAKIAEMANTFTMDDIISAISNKLINRHTHIFGNEKATSAAEALRIWESNKKKSDNPSQAIASVPKAFPALVRAAKVIKYSQKKLSCQETIINEIQTDLNALLMPNKPHLDIIGNILLKIVCLSTILGVNAEFSLTNAIEEFITTNIPRKPADSGL